MIFAFAHSSRSIFLLRCGVVVCKNLSVQLRSTLGQKMHPRKFGSLQNRPAESFFRLNCSVYINVENRERASLLAEVSLLAGKERASQRR